MADTIKCPNCGSNLTLNADTGLLDCPNCGSSFDPQKLAVTVEELEAKQAEPTDPSQAPAQADAQAQEQGRRKACNRCSYGCHILRFLRITGSRRKETY